MQMLTVLQAAGRDFDEKNDDNSGVVGPPQIVITWHYLLKCAIAALALLRERDAMCNHRRFFCLIGGRIEVMLFETS
jgi:hypothetical protein